MGKAALCFLENRKMTKPRKLKGSAIIGPDTRSANVLDREELIVADLNLNEIDQEFMTFDASGHYSRPDVFTFETKSEQAART